MQKKTSTWIAISCQISCLCSPSLTFSQFMSTTECKPACRVPQIRYGLDNAQRSPWDDSWRRNVKNITKSKKNWKIYWKSASLFFLLYTFSCRAKKIATFCQPSTLPFLTCKVNYASYFSQKFEGPCVVLCEMIVFMPWSISNLANLLENDCWKWKRALFKKYSGDSISLVENCSSY